MPNLVAYLVLFGWPIAVGILFSRLPLRTALVWSILGGYLLLPMRPSFDLPMLPTVDKTLIPSLAALAFCLASRESRARGAGAEWTGAGWLPQGGLARILMLMLALSPILTVLTNRDAFSVGPRVLPGMAPYDIGSAVYSQVIALAPFMLARRYLANDAGQETLLRCLVMAGVLYSIPIVIEIRLSPQINQWVYGFTQFSFVQQVRAGNFRPVVFLEHGLWTAMFTACAVIGAAALWRADTGRLRLRRAVTTGWLGLVLAASSSFGAFALAFIFAPLVRFAPTRVVTLVIAGVAASVLLYPMLRNLDVIPTRAVVSFASAVSSAERAGSLQYRIDNEDILLTHASERPAFGWGDWGRSRVYDPRTGRDISVTDGRWVIIFGTRGWFGYIAEFGLLTLPLIVAGLRRAPPSPWSLGLMAVLAANLVDLLPNASLTPITWMIAGAVLGQSERVHAVVPRGVATTARGTPPGEPRSPTQGDAEAAPSSPRSTASRLAAIGGRTRR